MPRLRMKLMFRPSSRQVYLHHHISLFYRQHAILPTTSLHFQKSPAMICYCVSDSEYDVPFEIHVLSLMIRLYQWISRIFLIKAPWFLVCAVDVQFICRCLSI